MHTYFINGWLVGLTKKSTEKVNFSSIYETIRKREWNAMTTELDKLTILFENQALLQSEISSYEAIFFLD